MPSIHRTNIAMTEEQICQYGKCQFSASAAFANSSFPSPSVDANLFQSRLQLDSLVHILHGRTVWNRSPQIRYRLLPRPDNDILSRMSVSNQPVLGLDERSNRQETCCPYRHFGHSARFPVVRLCEVLCLGTF